MLTRTLYFFFFILALNNCFASNKDTVFYTADHAYIQYTGRVDYSNPSLPKFWAPGVYVTIRFSGTYCTLQINDEEMYGKSHNYLEIAVDDQTPYRIQTKSKHNNMVLAKGLRKGPHTITICKNTEANIGYLELVGFQCSMLLPPPMRPERKIEFIGNSITCGMGNDADAIPCGQGEWYDQHNAWLAYGPLTARTLNAQWQLSAVSGIGLIHSCCGHKITMPQVFDKVYMNADSITWDFKRYRPDVVTVCLGQNDGIQDSATFCNAYIQFANRLRGYYPDATLVFLTSPMASPELNTVLKRYTLAVKDQLQLSGDRKTAAYFFSKRYSSGCSGHPDKQEHQEIARELTSFLKYLMNW